MAPGIRFKKASFSSGEPFEMTKIRGCCSLIVLLDMNALAKGIYSSTFALYLLDLQDACACKELTCQHIRAPHEYDQGVVWNIELHYG